ncbi:ABC transporter ATP-binding protein [Rufibacter glacialis]|uniref:ABC transporter ATP-binding protein n=1 Tax=Rufibacter glacialis TaxID=1259555 RepID=A0A5M8QH01_9BACT|nr:ABC transporter ATP-binding protein [Rufibacter glacialis]KAA6434431.1 ABC transporter ATP-binding protein [Rufibacter glacialis]GGK69532.1 iron ABC transporter [Rufibacter glacialis]
MTKQAIEVRDLSFSYGNTSILEEVNVSFPEGKFSVVLGRNGSGKSTLFNILSGMATYRQGSVKLMGRERKELSFADCAPLMGFLPQFHKSVFPFQVRDVVLTGRAAFSSFSPKKADLEKVEQAIEELEITHLLNRPYTELSGGEQQLVMIARVLVQNPSIILLDEPTNHLDVYYQTFVLEKLRKLSQDKFTVIAIMHDPNLAFLYADHCFFMKNKTVVKTNLSNHDSELLHYVYNVQFTAVQVKDKTIVVPTL